MTTQKVRAKIDTSQMATLLSAFEGQSYRDERRGNEAELTKTSTMTR